jgi:hypothetical protein
MGRIALYLMAGVVLVLSVLGIPLLGFILFLTFFGARRRAAGASNQLASTLMEDEDLLAQALQLRAFALFNRRAIVGITNSRVIAVQRGILGGFRMLDIQWKDLEDVTLAQNVLPRLCGSSLNFRHSNTGVAPIGIDGVASDLASAIYAKAQAQEQAWEEKRRVRRIEEVRAAAGGVVVNTPQSPVAPAGNRMLEEIAQAKAMLDAGAISDVEFNTMKAKILASA